MKKYIDDIAHMRGEVAGEMQLRIRDYHDRYVAIQNDGSEDDIPYIEIVNYNNKLVINGMMRTFVGSHIAQYLGNLHPFKHTIYITRHGESVYNLEKKIGGDSPLSALGREYGRRLAEFANYVTQGLADDLVCVTLNK